MKKLNGNMKEELICNYCEVKIPKGYKIQEGTDCPICGIGSIVLRKDIIKMLHEKNICNEHGTIIGEGQKLTSKNFNKVMLFLDNYKLNDIELRNNLNFYMYRTDSKYEYAVYLPVAIMKKGVYDLPIEITKGKVYDGYDIYAKSFKVSKQKFKEYLKKAPERTQQMLKEDAEQLKCHYEEQAKTWESKAKEKDLLLKMLSTK